MGDSVVNNQEAVARGALAEISPAGTVGALLERTTQDDGVATLSFLSTLSGYPGWHWSVSVAELPGQEPTVLEAELMPGEGALLSPDWVPWVDRLDEVDPVDDELVDDELVGPSAGVDQEHEAETESDDDGPEQPDAS